MALKVGDTVRYKPGVGTYGYEDALGADGRLPGTVVGFTRTRVRIEVDVRTSARRLQKTFAVDDASLVRSGQ